ncbi:LOW QUALITY PROTEIN: C6 zinc finger protein [Colletotrichum cereale]|nr:LOW QUALITY PROTEIN: C6 zinc finger protein [Colletotrichum cereale]
MARLGAVKVKTGCITCKIRRVKCDEARPACSRCTGTGRRCDGYVRPPAGAYAWAQLPRVRLSPTQSAPDAETRAVTFFGRNVAPHLAGPLDSYFWTHLVPQMSYQEPAANHAALAISSLYEAFSEGLRNAFAISQYNKAIGSTKREETVLVVCILFSCIDMLRGECQSAIDHCRHGINILNGIDSKSNFIKDYLEPAFCRLSISPFFFGASPGTFPAINLSFAVSKPPFRSLLEAQPTLDTLMARIVRYVRLADKYRLGDEACREPDATETKEREDIKLSLNMWLKEFQAVKQQKTARRCSLDDMREDIAERLFESKCLVGQIWIDTCFVRGEFRSIIDLAKQAQAIVQSKCKNSPRAKFTFECRSLTAMGLMKVLCHEKENMWELIKFEHGLQFGVVDDGELPPEERRIKNSTLQQEAHVMTEIAVARLLRELEGPVTVREEWQQA